MLDSEKLAEKIIESTEGITSAEEALEKFWEGVCEYVEENAEVNFTWVGVNAAGVTDPVVSYKGKIVTSGELKPSGATTAADAILKFQLDINTAISSWTILPEDEKLFEVAPVKFILGSVVLSPSGATNRDAALKDLASKIIAGIKAASVTLTTTGVHLAFTGTGTYSGIL